MTLWLYLHFPALQLDSLFCEYHDAPLAIVDPRTHRLIQLNPIAEQQGLAVGAGLGSAAAMCHDLQVHPYDAKVEQQAILDIAQWLYAVTSDISVFAPQGIMLKVSDMLALYGGLESYWQALSAHLKQLKLRYFCSTGFSPYCAMLLAKSGHGIITENKLELEKHLHPRSLAATELSVKHIEKLERVGIQTLSDLLALPLPDIARRFDIDLVNYVGRLMGQFKHPLETYHPPAQFQHHLVLLFDIENIQWLEKPLYGLLKKLDGFLRLRDQVAYELQLTLHQRDKSINSITFTSASGDYQADKWQKLCQLTLESLKLDAPVQELTLSVVRSAQRETANPDIFDGIKGQQTPLELISLLQAKLGQQRVRKVAYSHDPRPEKANQLCDPTTKLPEFDTPTPLRPTFIYPHPLPFSDMPFNRKMQLVHGPERLLTGWWDGEPITRDYFIAHNETGQWLWVYRTPQKQWFVHGQFS